MSKVYVGNLPLNVTERDIEDLFAKFGKIRSIQVKIPPRPPAYAFVEFDDSRDADDAIEERDGYEFNGDRIRVESARGRERRRENRGSPLRSKYRVVVKGLPSTASWQDLKDHMRKAGEVTFTDVDHKGYGIVEYKYKDDMEYALRKLDDSEFKNPFDRVNIRVYKAKSSSRSRSSSRRRRKSRSDSRSRRRKSRSDSRSRRRKSRSDSRSRSKSRKRARSSSRSRSNSRKRSPSPKASVSKHEKSPSKSVSSRSSAEEHKSDRSTSQTKMNERKEDNSSRSESRSHSRSRSRSSSSQRSNHRHEDLDNEDDK